MKIQDISFNTALHDAIRLSKKILNLNNIPKIEIVDSINNNGQSSFGVFDGESIQVVIKDRHIIDSVRTVAHELVHHKQRLMGDELDGATGSKTENQANATAGVIMREFGRMYPEYFLDTLPN